MPVGVSKSTASQRKTMVIWPAVESKMSWKCCASSVPTDWVIAALSKAAIDEIFIDRTRAAFARESTDQTPSGTGGAASCRSDGRRCARAADNRSARRTGRSADGCARARANGCLFRDFTAAAGRLNIILRLLHALVDIALCGAAADSFEMSVRVQHRALR